MGWRAQKLWLPHQCQGDEILHRACRERSPPDDRALPHHSLAEARAAAKRALAEKTLGKMRPNTTGYLAAIDEFLTHSEKKNRARTVSEYKRLLTTHFPFGTTRLADITSEQIEKRLKPLGDRPSEQQHAFTATKVFFNWAQKRCYVQSNPCASLFSPSKTESRSRFLTDAELRTVLRQARAEIGAYQTIIELLILTGQRRGEIAALQWDWIDQNEHIITLPATLTKNKREHTFPYGPMVAAVLETVPRTSAYLFPAAKERRKGQAVTVFAGWNRPKVVFDQRCKIPAWTLHDLRRTFATISPRSAPRSTSPRNCSTTSPARSRASRRSIIGIATWTKCAPRLPVGKSASRKLLLDNLAVSMASRQSH